MTAAATAASCLNEFAARVWRECDGETSVAEIAAALGEDERAVWLALHQLTKAQLLTEAIAFPPDMSAAKSRREIGARLGLGAAAFVASIVAPMPAQAASCGRAWPYLHSVRWVPAVPGLVSQFPTITASVPITGSARDSWARSGRGGRRQHRHADGGPRELLIV